MLPANAQSVLGDFDNSTVDYFGVTTHFSSRSGQYYVRTDGADGKLHEYQIKYTFGVTPLQQYLVEFPGGRLQALSIAWDSRPKEQGGQRWFQLHPDEQIKKDDVLHWTGPNMNWNYMCADCHSTNLKKNYDAISDSYRTTWAEINVACEACHGPGSRHIEWAEEKTAAGRMWFVNKGLKIKFNERTGVNWVRDKSTGLVRRSRTKTSETEIEVCARCHSRRSQLTDNVAVSDPLLDAYRPALLTEPLYHADGQIKDEVYVYGSFLQSKMYRAGVTCSDCHDPHSGQTRLPGDKVCSQCHAPQHYASRKHHFHKENSKGASCVECHMPATTYMQVDARHDHSMRIPRADLSLKLGTPNACNNCHTDRNAAWAAGNIKKWYGNPSQGYQRYAPALHAARHPNAETRQLLHALVADPDQPAIARATALSSLRDYPEAKSLQQLQGALHDRDPLVRLAALQGLSGFGARQRVIAFALLDDKVRAVRIEAARLLAAIPSGDLPQKEQASLQKAIAEYLAVQNFSAERPEAQLNLAGIYGDLGDIAKAEAAYRRALKLQPRFVPAYVNLAEFYNSQHREADAAQVLHQGLEINPQSTDLNHAKGLSLVREGKSAEALTYLARAAQLDPQNVRYGYVYAIALHSSGERKKALSLLQSIQQQHSGNAEVLFALVTINRDAGHIKAARRYLQKLDALVPNHPTVQQLRRELH